MTSTRLTLLWKQLLYIKPDNVTHFALCHSTCSSHSQLPTLMTTTNLIFTTNPLAGAHRSSSYMQATASPETSCELPLWAPMLAAVYLGFSRSLPALPCPPTHVLQVSCFVMLSLTLLPLPELHFLAPLTLCTVWVFYPLFIVPSVAVFMTTACLIEL